MWIITALYPNVVGDMKNNVWIRLKGEVCHFFCVEIVSNFTLMNRDNYKLDLNSEKHCGSVSLCSSSTNGVSLWAGLLVGKAFFLFLNQKLYSCILALHFVLLCTSKIILIIQSALFLIERQFSGPVLCPSYVSKT